ncbi:MAG: hypothetical protein V3U89_03355 [Methylophilaceae bacterium]
MAGSLLASILFASTLQAEVLPEAQLGLKMPLAKVPTTRPMTVAYHPVLKHYYVADGGLAPLGSEWEAPISKSQVHAFNAEGKYINSANPGYDNRSIYYNTNTGDIETITYNISSEFGFAPNTGMYALEVDETGKIKDTSKEIMQFHSAFGDAFTMPTYDAENKRYFAKQKRSNKVLIVAADKDDPIGDITLDIAKAGAKFDDISDNFVAFTGKKGEELALLDLDHKAILIFDLSGKFIAKSALPKGLKLRAKNYYNGLGYTNDMFFLYHENEGEFGTYHGYKVIK